jgi:hypothetical protein
MTTEEDILRLMAQVRHLEEANAHETGRANKLAADLASTQANLESIRWSIIAACSGTKCLNAHELRFNLDEARQNVKILAAEVKAWRAWYEEEMDINVTEPLLYQAVINAWRATDAAKAMEERCGS